MKEQLECYPDDGYFVGPESGLVIANLTEKNAIFDPEDLPIIYC